MYAIFGPLLKFECAFADKLFHFHFTLKTFYSFYLNKYLNEFEFESDWFNFSENNSVQNQLTCTKNVNSQILTQWSWRFRKIFSL